MLHSESVANLTKALVAAQGAFEIAKKGTENPFFKSTYADLPEVWRVAREHLGKNGLAVIQATDECDDGVVIETMLSHVSGEWVASRLKMKPVRNDPQGIGSCITYARRYALCAMVGIVADVDDDGNAATHAAPPSAKRETQKGKTNADANTVVNIARGIYLEYQKLGFGKDEIFGIFDAVTGRKDPERMTQENIDSLRRDLDLRKKSCAAATSGNEGRERIAQQKGGTTGIGEVR